MQIDQKDSSKPTSPASEMVLPMFFVAGLFALVAILSQIS
jgi:hypothetical protein